MIEIDPLSIATLGLLSNNALTIATDGFIVIVTEEIVEPDIIQPRGIGGGGATRRSRKKKRIKATVFFDGREYSDSIEVDDLSITIRDVKVKVDMLDKSKPKISITLKDSYDK